VYLITQSFHQYLAAGMAKDLSLQKAKLDFLSKSGREHQLPYFWANITLNGSFAPIVFASEEGNPLYYWLAAAFIAILLFVLWQWARQKRRTAGGTA
jgi:hypothetical protein